MSRRKGSPKTGGKKKGTPNKATAARRAAIQRTRDLSAEAVVEQLRRNALYDPRRLFGADGKLKPLTELTEADAAMIEGIDVVRRQATDGSEGTEEVIRLKIASRAAYVRMAGELHQLFITRIDAPQVGDLVALLSRKVVHELHPGPTLHVQPPRALSAARDIA